MLVAVSIPIFTSQLEKSREATDLANLRAAKAAAVTAILDGNPKKNSVEEMLLNGETVYYNPATGLLQKNAIACGKGTELTISSVKYGTDQPYKEYGYDGTSTTTKSIQLQYETDTDKLTVSFA